jgi:hypothetical protein
LRNLAVLAEELVDWAEEQRLWANFLEACPGDAEAKSREKAQR